MGNANCTVSNRTQSPLVLLTFNNADTIYTSYNQIYTIQPGQNIQVEAAADGWGLKVAVVYNDVGGQLLWRLFMVKNGDTLTINSVKGQEMSVTGDQSTFIGHTSVNADMSAAFMKTLDVTVQVGVGVIGADL
ncbi:hypothetical protein ACA910_010459 [Epithemia clementina (nom. ined.)]